MRKIAIAVVAIVTLLVAVIVVPRMINWQRFEHHIAQAVHDATGREVRIDGEIDVTLLPAITFTAREIHLANPSSFGASDMASIDAIEGRIQVWPFFGKRVVVERLVIRGLDVALEVDENGRDNWSVEPRTSESDEATEGDGELPIADLRLDDVRLLDGTISYRNAATGQEVIGRDLDLALSLVGLDAPLDVQGQATLNDEPVTLLASIFRLDAVLNASSGRLALLLESAHVEVRLDAGLQAGPELGLKGQASVDVPSIGMLATWLNLPYEKDPGPLRVSAYFDSDGTAFALQRASIEGTQLSVQASASVESSDELTRVSVKLRSGLLDLDSYLPLTPRDAAAASAEPTMSNTGDDDPLGMLPDTVFDLSGLRELVADVDVAIDGIAVAGYMVGPIRITGTADDGLVSVDLDEIGLGDGSMSGSLRLDARSDTLTAQTNVVVANVNIGALTSVAAGNPPPVAGNASGRLLASTSGTTPRELVRNIIGEIDASLESAGGPEITGQLTALSLAVDREHVDADGHLRGSAMYGGEEVTFDLQTDLPISTLLLSDPIGVNLRIDSEMLTTSYQGRVVPAPVAALDGELRAEIPSVAAFAAWLGQPLPQGQADPGGIQAYARLRSDGTSGAVEEATIQGEGLDLRATGSFDASGQLPRFDLAIDGGLLQLDRYMPVGDADAAADGENPGDSADPLAALSDEPIDLSAMRAQEGRITVALDGVRTAVVELGAIELEGTLEGGKLAIVVDRLGFADGTVTARLDADGSGDALDLNTAVHVADIEAAQLDALLSGEGITLDGMASGELKLSSNGGTVRQLVTGATGAVQLDLPGATFGEGPISTVAAIDASLDSGAETGPRLDATMTLNPRSGGAAVNVDLKAQLGPLSELLGGATVPFDVLAKIGKITLETTGQIAGLEGMPNPDLQLRFDAERLSDLNPLTGADLTEAGPVSVAARLTAENNLYRVAELDARISNSDLRGEITVQPGNNRPRLTADLSSELIDVAELFGQAESEQTAASGQEEPPSIGQASTDEEEEAATQFIPEDPLPIDALNAFDAEVNLAISKLRTHVGTDVDNFMARVELADGDLRLAPVTGKSAGGDFELNLDLVSQGSTSELNVDLHADQWLMGTFSDIIRSSTGSVGKLDAVIQLQGAGASPHAIASSLDGEVRLVGKGGAVDSTVMQVLSLGLGDLFDVFGDGKESTFLNCFVVRFDFKDGVGSARSFLVDFPDISIIGAGTIDLAQEQVDLEFKPDSKNQSFVSLAVPFDVSGPLASPKIRPDAGGTGVQALKGAGLAVLFLNPITVLPAAAAAAALVGADMIQDATGENPCVVALRNAEAVGEAAPDKGWFESIFGAD